MAAQDSAMISVGGIKKFLREVKIELNRVTWPTRKQLTAYTAVVLIAVVLAALLIGLFDSVFAYLFKIFFRG